MLHIKLTERRASPGGRSPSRGEMCPPLPFFLFGQEITSARGSSALRGDAFLRFDEGFLWLWHVVHVRRDGDEDAKVVCRLDQLANHADGLRARVAMDVVVSPTFGVKVPSSKMVATTGYPEFLNL